MPENAEATRVQRDQLAEALKALPEDPKDAAIRALARRLARLIDELHGTSEESAMVIKLAAEYRQVLSALMLTPQSRMAAARGVVNHDVPAPRSPLDELRARRKARDAS